MSSLVGVYDPGGNLPSDEQLAAALAVMARRGAEKVTIFRQGPVAMALAAFDPSRDGRNPGLASTPDGRSMLLLDGILDNVEINAPAAQKLLGDLSGTPDSAIAALCGDFALAFWDDRNQRLLLARDHLGARPMCVVAGPDRRVMFASTPRALVALGHRPQVDLQAVAMVMQLGTMPAPWSGWAGIERLRPSELAVASDQGLQRRAYWKLELAQRSDLPEAEHVRRLRQALEESVADVLAGVSDPLFCMSGGIDSTAIAAIGRRMLGRKIRTVCLGFSPEEKDDRPYARRAAEFVDTDHSEVMITPEKVGEHLERIADVLEVPSVLSYCEFLLSLQVAGGTRLLVTGETADSQFGGTSPFIFLRQLAMYQKVPRPMRRGLAGMLKAIFRPDAVLFGKHPGLIVRLLDDADRASEVQRYLTIRRYFNYEDVCRLLPQGAIGKGDVEEYLETIGRPYHGRPMDAMLAFHLRHEAANEYLADDLKLPCPLVYRSPYTSQRMVKLSSAMPIGLKVRGAIRKYALIEAVKDILPPEAITRKKMGFGLPLDEWLWGPLRDLVRENLSAASLPAFLNADEVVRIRDAFLGSKERMYFRETWLLLTVAMWARKHLAGA